MNFQFPAELLYICVAVTLVAAAVPALTLILMVMLAREGSRRDVFRRCFFPGVVGPILIVLLGWPVGLFLGQSLNCFMGVAELSTFATLALGFAVWVRVAARQGGGIVFEDLSVHDLSSHR
jgi:hypothetical protein